MPTHITPFIEVCSDFDVTIPLEDIGCILIDAGFGADNRDAAKQVFLNKNDKVVGQEHIIVLCGDGIPDLSAARETVILFAGRGL
ncbi:hypothetical protein BGZ93_002069 [Podila epicladia]|nr:hypothetical protein BGZ93_002069 [Podila epicladia]